MIDVAVLHRFLRVTKIGGDALLLLFQIASYQEEPGARGEDEEKLRHGLESKARPKRSRLDRRDDVGGQPAGPQGEIEGARSCLLYTSPSPRDRTRSRM